MEPGQVPAQRSLVPAGSCSRDRLQLQCLPVRAREPNWWAGGGQGHSLSRHPQVFSVGEAAGAPQLCQGSRLGQGTPARAQARRVSMEKGRDVHEKAGKGSMLGSGAGGGGAAPLGLSLLGSNTGGWSCQRWGGGSAPAPGAQDPTLARTGIITHYHTGPLAQLSAPPEELGVTGMPHPRGDVPSEQYPIPELSPPSHAPSSAAF